MPAQAQGQQYRKRRYCHFHCVWETAKLWYTFHDSDGGPIGSQCRVGYQKQLRADNGTTASALATKALERDATGCSIGFLVAREDIAAMQSCVTLLQQAFTLPIVVLAMGFTQCLYWREPIIMATTLLLVSLQEVVPGLPLDLELWSRLDRSRVADAFQRVLDQVCGFTKNTQVVCSARAPPTLLARGTKRSCFDDETRHSFKNPSERRPSSNVAKLLVSDIRSGAWLAAAKDRFMVA